MRKIFTPVASFYFNIISLAQHADSEKMLQFQSDLCFRKNIPFLYFASKTNLKHYTPKYRDFIISSEADRIMKYEEKSYTHEVDIIGLNPLFLNKKNTEK